MPSALGLRATIPPPLHGVPYVVALYSHLGPNSAYNVLSLQNIAPWLYEPPMAFGGYPPLPAGVFTQEMVLGMVANSIAEGEQVGYVDYEAPALPTIPLGTGDGGTYVYGPTGIPVFKSKVPYLPTVFDPSGDGRGDEQPGDVGYAWDPDPTEVHEIPNASAEYPYEEIPGVDPLEPEGDVNVAIDWGSVLSGSIDLLQGQTVGGGPTYMAQPGTGVTVPGTPVLNQPTNVTVNTKTGKVTPCRRRRRRRLLTEGDFNDLMRIATLPSKQNVAVALSKAVGRR